MKYFHKVLMASLAVLLFAGLGAAQQKPEQKAQRMIPLKVQVVLSEYDGAKKISSLPYTFTVNAAANLGLARSTGTHLRLGLHVPVQTAESKWQYQNVGTNIDCSAQKLSDSDYKLEISVERTSVYLPSTRKDGAAGPQTASDRPVIRTFRVASTLLLRVGQSDVSTVATDPISGDVLHVSVALQPVKPAR
jgi:hypothetical protein